MGRAFFARNKVSTVDTLRIKNPFLNFDAISRVLLKRR